MINGKIRNRIIIFIIIMLIIDQISKIVVINNSFSVGIISFEAEEKAKMKFMELLFSMLTDIAIFAVIIKFIKEQSKNMNRKIRVSLELVLAGGISNFVDKIWNGNVVTFIKIAKLPILNFSYILIFIGWISFLIFMAKDTIKIKDEMKSINQYKGEKN